MKILIKNNQYEKIVEEHKKFKHYSVKDIINLFESESERAEIKTVDDISNILKKAADLGGLTQQSDKKYKYSKEVEALQTALLLLGSKLPIHGIDGKYGPETAQAVIDFKKKTDNSKSTEKVEFKGDMDIKDIALLAKELFKLSPSKETIEKLQMNNDQEESLLPKKSKTKGDEKSDSKSDKKTENGSSTTTDSEYVIIKSSSKTKNFHVLFGGAHTNLSYSKHGANLSAMKNYISVLNQYTDNVNIIITHHMNTLDNVEKYVKDNYNGNVTSIAGFSQGGKETWEHAQDSSLKLVGLIDPSTYGTGEKLGSNTYMVCNPNNWGSKGFVGDVKKRLKWYCEHQSQYGSHLECVKDSHWGCLKYFYSRYSSKL